FLFTGYWTQAPFIPPGTALYRAVAYDERPTHVGQLGYPPTQVVKRLGRVNRVGQSIFYCSPAREAPFFELQCQQGTKLALSRWRTTERLIMQPVGFSDATFIRLASSRQHQPLVSGSNTTPSPEEAEAREVIHEFLCEEFTKEVADGQFEDYSL